MSNCVLWSLVRSQTTRMPSCLSGGAPFSNVNVSIKLYYIIRPVSLSHRPFVAFLYWKVKKGECKLAEYLQFSTLYLKLVIIVQYLLLLSVAFRSQKKNEMVFNSFTSINCNFIFCCIWDVFLGLFTITTVNFRHNTCIILK